MVKAIVGSNKTGDNDNWMVVEKFKRESNIEIMATFVFYTPNKGVLNIRRSKVPLDL